MFDMLCLLSKYFHFSLINPICHNSSDKIVCGCKSSKENHSQCGRTILEMLAVLSILGALTVATMAGYKKAIFTFQVNSTIDQITQIVINTQTLFAQQRSYVSMFDDPVVRMVFPDKIGNDISGLGLNVWDGHVWIFPANLKENGDYKSFVYSARVPRDACIALASHDWGSGSNSSLVGMVVGQGYIAMNNSAFMSEDINMFRADNGKQTFYLTAKYLPLSPSKAAEYCRCSNRFGEDDNYGCGFALQFK